MTQSICSSLSSPRSRLVRMTETASIDNCVMAFLPVVQRWCTVVRQDGEKVRSPSAGVRGAARESPGEVVRAGGLRKHLGERQDSRRRLQQETGSAELVQ